MNTRSHQPNERPRRKYAIIAKVEAAPVLTKNCFVKYRANDIDKTIKFLHKKWPGFFYANIFSNKGQDKNKMLYTYGKFKGLQPAHR